MELRPMIHDIDPAPTPGVVLPFVDGMLQVLTVESVRADVGLNYTLAPIDPHDPYAYGRVLVKMWNEGDDLVVVEQDIVVPAGGINEMLGCFHEWCGFTYHCNQDKPAHGLGLCKFSVALQLAHPELARNAARHQGTGAEMHVPWISLNERYHAQLKACGVEFHSHGVAEHLHDYS